MKNLQPSTAIFLIGSGIYMLDFYNFSYLKKMHNHKLVAIVNENIMHSFSDNQKNLFDKIYVVSESKKPALCHLSFDEAMNAVKEELNYIDSPGRVRIFPFNEYNVLLAAYIREKLGIPGANPEMVMPFRDKFLMKNILQKGGIRTPRFFSLNLHKLKENCELTFEEIRDVIGVPFIVKPVDGAGGLGVKKILSQDDFKNFTKELLPSVSGYEVEEFLDGELYHCDVLFRDQKPILSLCAKYNYPLLDFKNGKNVGSMPLLDSHPLKQKIIEFTLEALQEFRLPNGILHTEVFYLPSSEELVFLETAARAPGASIIPMYEKTFGINLLDCDFLINMGQYQFNRTDFNSYCFWAVFPPVSGRVTNMFKPHLESDYKLEWFVKIGDDLAPAFSMRERVGRIFVWNRDHAALQRDFEHISANSFIDVKV